MSEGFPSTGWLIYKGGRGWYRPEAQGYTSEPAQAGRYTYDIAMSYSHPNGLDGPRDGMSIKHESEVPGAIPQPDLAAENQRLRAEVEALREALEKAQNPSWFYHPDYTERCLFSPCEVIDDYYDPEPGKHVFEIECARPLPSIWCAVHCLTDAERDAMDTGERFIVTEHASEEEARAALTRKAPQ